jgi:hypothetical protein
MASITIPLFYDLDLLRFTTAAGGIALQPNLVLGQSDEIDFAVQFVQGGVGINLPPITSIICGIKPINDVSGDYLASTTSFTQAGSGTTRVYTFTLLLDSVELRAWLLTVTAVSNYAAFSILSAEHKIATLPAITCTILPDYNLTGTTPTAASGILIVDSAQTFTVHKSFAMPTTDGTTNYVLQTNGSGVGNWVAQSTSTGTVTNVAVTTANGVSGTVANPTASAAITIALGAITPTTGAFSSTTDATNSTTAPLKTAGGLAVAKSLYVGQLSYFGDTAEFSGALRVNNIGALGITSLAFTDQASNPTFKILSVSDSVNNVAIEPSVTGSPPHIYAQGTDTNIGLHLSPKGTGYVNVQDGTDTTKRLRFGASGNGTGIITTLESSSTSSQTITLPNATGATTLAGLQMTQTFTAANTFSLATDATSSSAGAVMISGGLAVAKKLYVGTTLFLSNGHRVTFFTSTTTISQPTLYGVDGGGGQGTITFGSFGADGTTALYGGINQTPALINCYSATLTCSYVAFQPSGGLKDSGGNIALTVTSNKAIAMGGTLAVTGTTTCTGGVIFGTYTVSNFPQTTYLEAVVTDALVPVVGSTVNAGGNAKCKVMYNGSAKIVTAVL